MEHLPLLRHFRDASFALCAPIAVLVTMSAPSRAQCQTWALEPQFDAAHVGGSWVRALQTFDDGSGPKLWVGGDFGTIAGGRCARWDGHQWLSGGGGQLSEYVDCFGVYDSGQGPRLYVGGPFALGGGIARWNGSWWQTFEADLLKPSSSSQVPAWVQTMATFESGGRSELYIGGSFAGVPNAISPGLIRWDGVSYRAMSSPLGPASGYLIPVVQHLAVYDDGQGPALYVAGVFDRAGGQPIRNLAKWDGSSWSGLGSGIVGGNVLGLAVWNDGSGSKLYVGGTFTSAGGVPVHAIAIWNGVSWAPFPVPPISLGAGAMCPFDDGRGPALFVATTPQVGSAHAYPARWDGTSWSALGGNVTGSIATIEDIEAFDDGSGHGPDLYFGGAFSGTAGVNGVPSNRIARWIGCAAPIDAFCPGDHTLIACPCANPGQPGRGCENSQSTGGAKLIHAGTTAPDTLRLISSGELASSLTVFLQGSAPTLIPVSFGDGLRCTSGTLLRLYVANAVAGTANAPGDGHPSISATSSALGDPLLPGAVRLYPAYYRDPVSTCGAFFNASSGLRVVW